MKSKRENPLKHLTLGLEQSVCSVHTIVIAALSLLMSVIFRDITKHLTTHTTLDRFSRWGVISHSRPNRLCF